MATISCFRSIMLPIYTSFSDTSAVPVNTCTSDFSVHAKMSTGCIFWLTFWIRPQSALGVYVWAPSLPVCLSHIRS